MVGIPASHFTGFVQLTSEIVGIGDAAIYQSNAPIRAMTTALVKGNMILVTFQSADARAKKDQAIALLKAAAGRL